VDAAPAARAPRGAIALALASVYLIWGSTYLAIDIAVDSLPPLGLGALRFLIAGVLLYAAVRPFAARPTARQWGAATLVGGFLLAGGNGLVCVAEQRVPSGIAALIVATTPLWMALLTWSTGGARPGWRESLGIVFGLIGVALLGAGEGERIGLVGVLMVLGAALSWAIGSLWSRRLKHAPSPWLATAMQMLAGGALLAALSLALEWPRIAAIEPTARSLWALAYLIAFGSIVGFGSYVYLLRCASPVVATSYAYVNPLVAVALGWLLNDELVDRGIAIPAALIIGAVLLILTAPRPAASAAR